MAKSQNDMEARSSRASRSEDFEETKDDIRSIRENSRALGQHLKDDVIELKDDVREMAKSVKAGARERMADAKVAVNKSVKGLEERVRERPAQSLGIAFALGTLLSFLLRRR